MMSQMSGFASFLWLNNSSLGFPSGSVGKEFTCNAGDLGSVPGLGISPGEEHSNPLQYSCLENPPTRGAWWAIAHGVTKSRKQLVTEHGHMCRLRLLHSSIEFHQQHNFGCPFCSPSLARFYSMIKYQLTNHFLCELQSSHLWFHNRTRQ